MSRILLTVAVLLSVSSPLAAVDPRELALQLKEVEKERDDLRRELALAKLKIATLEDKLAAAGGGKDTAAPAGTAATAGTTEDSAEEELDDAGIAKRALDWEVKVLSSKTLDVNDINAEIKRLESDVKTARSQLQGSKQRADKMRLENERWDRYYRSDRNRKKPYTDDVIAGVRTDIKRLEGKERGLSSRIKSLERERSEANKTLVVTCEAKDGSVLRLLAKGASYSAAEAMQVGKNYVVEGRKGGVDLIVLTKVSTVAD